MKPSVKRGTADFDAFYAEARGRLLLQTYVLTGDLRAARAGVRDAFISAWHHWRKVSRRDDPEAYVRHHAFNHGQRLATARIWHKERIDPDAASVLEALAALSHDQRRMLVLTTLCPGSISSFAREIGASDERAERLLSQAQSTYSTRRAINASAIDSSLDPLRAIADEVRWPRITIIRRAGTARRRTHTAVGMAGVVATLVLSGIVVTQGGDVRPALAGPDRPVDQSNVVTGHETADETHPLTTDDLMGDKDVRRLAPRRDWGSAEVAERAPATSPLCWEGVSGDPGADAAVSTSYVAAPVSKKGKRAPLGKLVARQVTERSATDDDASTAFETILNWHSGCLVPRVQLVESYDVPGIGDQASVVTLKLWQTKPTLVTLAVARTGRIGTSITAESKAGPGVPAKLAAAELARAVDRLCDDDAGGRCSRDSRLRAAAPLPVGEVPGLLSEIDLPGVAGVTKPWVGTDPEPARFNYAASGCARANFLNPAMTSKLTRSFVIPDKSLPSTFGITETVASLPIDAGRDWINDTKSRLAQCVERRLGTEISRLTERQTKTQDLTVWRVTTELSDTRSVSYFMALLRNGTAVAQLGFIQGREARTPSGEFVALADRALARLPRLPEPPRKKKAESKKAESKNQASKTPASKDAQAKTSDSENAS